MYMVLRAGRHAGLARPGPRLTLLKHIAHAKLAPDPLHVDRLALVARPQNCDAVTAGWRGEPRVLWHGVRTATTQPHQLRKYLFVFRDMDMKRVEGSSALIRRAHQLHPL